MGNEERTIHRCTVLGGGLASAVALGSAGDSGSNPLPFRPSGTQHSTPLLRTAVRTAGYFRCFSYDADPMHCLDPGSATVVRRTLGDVRSGSIVSRQLGHRGTVDALPAILAGLEERGLAPRTVSELLA